MPHVPYEEIDLDKESDAWDDRIQGRQQVKDKDKNGLCSDDAECRPRPPEKTLIPLIIGPPSDFGYWQSVLVAALFPYQ